MFNFKSIVKQITDRGRDSNPESPSKVGAEDLSSAQKAEGFLCPKCMKQFASPFELQIHYESMHDDDRPNESSMHDLSGSLSSLSSKEKKDDTGGTIGPIDADIPDLSPSISVDDVLALTDVSDLQQRLRQTLLRKSVLESRVLELAQSNVGLKASVDDLQRSLSILNERHRVVEAQLAHRESIDDAAVLRQELIQVQRVMDEMNRERERERDALQAELQCLTDQQTPILEKLKMSLMEKEKECAQLSDELAECKSKYETVKCQLTDLEGARKSEDNDFAFMKDTISSLEEELRQAHTDLQGIRMKVQQPSTQTKEDIDIQCSLDDSSLLKTDNGEKLERKLSECESQIKDLNQKLSSAHDRISHLEVEKAELVSKYGSCDDASSGNEFSTSALLEQLEAYKIENQKLERSNAELSDNQAFVNLEISNQINAQKRLQVQLEDSKSEMNQLRKCLKDCELSLEVKDSALRTMESQIQELKETVTAAKKNHVDMSAENKRLMEGKIHLEKEVSSSKEENLFLKAGHEELQKKLVDMEHEHQSVQEEHLQEIGRLRVTVQEKTNLLEKQEDAVMLLVNERAELDRRLESLRADYAEQVEALKQQLKQTESGLREQEKAQQLLQTQLSSEVKKCETLEAEFQKLREFSDTAIQVKSDELKAMQASLDEAAGEKLALEAQLETAVAERQKLLERCYAATNEVEVLQHTVSDLRRKWDESEAALQELGRENATLQLDIEKLLGRKWTEDADVSSCTLCSRDFTMLLRKHHCRNCGQIFCNECSSKTAAVVSNKKPVRVCDSCYTELIAK